MALTILPADGLMQRLLQQNSRAVDVPRENNSRMGQAADQVNISSEARKQSSSDSAQTYVSTGYATSYNNQENLEARLLSLYNNHQELSENK